MVLQLLMPIMDKDIFIQIQREIPHFYIKRESLLILYLKKMWRWLMNISNSAFNINFSSTS